MKADGQKISVTIPYYQGEQDILACVRSIRDSSFAVRCVYIIDNSPEPAPLHDLLSPLEGKPEVRAIRTRPAIGFGRACNIGVYRGVAAGDDICIILNQDAVLDPRCLEHLISPFTLDPEIFAVVPVAMTYDFEEFNPKTLANYILPVENLIHDWLLGRLQSYYPLRCDQANGACVAFRAADVPQVGLFDPFFRMYGEDLELFQRAKSGFGRRLVLAPQARIGHRHSNFSLTGKEADRIDGLTRFGRQVAQIKNPEKPFAAALLEAVMRNLRPYLRALRAGNWRQIGNYLQKDRQLLGALPLLFRSRKPEVLRKRIRTFVETDVV